MDVVSGGIDSGGGLEIGRSGTEESAARVVGTATGVTDTAREMAGNVSDKASEAGNAVSEKMDRAGASVGEATEDAKEAVGNAVEGVFPPSDRQQAAGKGGR